MSALSLRRKARQLLVQALYQWQMSDTPSNEIIAQFLVDNSPTKFDVNYFQEVLCGVINEKIQLDEHLKPFTRRELKDLDPVELAILRLATYELLFKLDIPYRVVINEAVEQAKRYGATDGHKYVNGVIDKLAQKIREIECKK